MAPRALGRLVALGAALALAGCEKKDAGFAGTYEGEGVDSQSSSNVKTFTLRVADSGTSVSGNYTLKAIILDVSGTVAGTLNGNSLDLTLTPGASSNDCPYHITGTWSGDRISGTYAAFSCFVRSDGQINLKKQ